MNKFLENMKKIDNFTFTENGAGAYKSTLNPVLDAFGSLGAMKDNSETEIINMFMPAFFSDREKAIRMLFYMRDIRGGQGMRRVFRVILRYLANNFPEYVTNNLDNVLFFGRGDDYLVLLGTECEKAMMNCINDTLTEDLTSVQTGGGCSLLAKWLPSENTSSAEARTMARQIMRALELTPRKYRKMLSLLRAEIGIVEAKMSQNKWNEIDFEKLPAKAAMIYTDAFVKHAEKEYLSYLGAVANGNAKVNAKSLFPVDIVKKVRENYNLQLKDRILLDAMWNALPNYLEGVDESAICVCDTSGSMNGEPINVALSLGIYCADKCNGPFKNHFITFSNKPALQEIIGDNIVDKVRNMNNADWDMNTDLEKVFKLILDTAKKYHMVDEDIPKKLYIISDMQFDEASTHYGYGYKPTPITFMQTMRQRFEDAGYTFPAIVYWNVRQSNCGMFQETVDGENCCMVSGYSPSLFKAVLDGTTYEVEVNNATGEVSTKQKIDPIDVMNAAIMAERYDRVWVG